MARRTARQLAAHSLAVWLDEAELRIGAELPSSLRHHIAACDVVVVIASVASAASTWVALELEHARAAGKTIVPLFVEAVETAEMFRNHLGVDGKNPTTFALRVGTLVAALLQSQDGEVPPADRELLTSSLRSLALEVSTLQPLIGGCLDGQGLPGEHMETVLSTDFHPLDFALHALFELNPTAAIAAHAAFAFDRAGAGAEALRRWIETSGDGGTALVTAVSKKLDVQAIEAGLALLATCTPPNDHALYNFIANNAEQLTPEQRRRTLQLVTSPRQPTGLTDVLGAVALRHFAGAGDVRMMWQRWIADGCFDGSPKSPGDLALNLWLMNEEGVQDVERLCEALRSHVRGLVRSADRQNVAIAVDHLRANPDRKTPALAQLLAETNGVSGTAEWNSWEKKDPETAREMGWHVFTHREQALGARDWSAADEEARKLYELDRRRRTSPRALQKRDRPTND